MSSASRSLPTHGIPPRDDTVKGPQLPLVDLADLNDSEKTRLIQHLQGSVKNGENLSLLPWRPSSEALHSIARQGPFPDSQATLYATAVLASRAGWDGLLVADQLTKRQLTATLRMGEYPTVSVVMVSIRPATGEGQLHIFAKRTAGPIWPLGESERELVYEDILTELSSFEPGSPTRDYNPFADAGLALHDPDRSPFTPDTSEILGWEQYPETDAPHIELAESTTYKGHGYLNVFLLFPTTEEERKSTESALQQAIDVCLRSPPQPDEKTEDYKPPSVQHINLIPWESHKAESRRQLIGLWNAFQRCIPLNGIARDVFLLKEPIEDVAHVELGVVSFFFCGGHKFAQVPLSQIVPIKGCSVACNWSRYETGFELAFPPEEPFYVTTPNWQPTSIDLNWIPVFYLTTKLTPEQDKAVRDELVKITDSDWADSKNVCYVPWTKDESRDGNLDDMWEVFWDLYTYKRGRAVPYGSSTPVFFIDQQSGIDQTVIAAADDTLYIDRDNPGPLEFLKGVDAPGLRGFMYNRIPGWQAHGAFVNISIGNMGFDEFGDEAEDEVQIKTYPRPGWPGHGVLEDAE